MNKRAQEILGFMTAFAVFVAISVFFYYRATSGPPENFIGQAQLELLTQAKEGEKAILYVEQSARLATPLAIFNVAKDSSVCGTYLGFSIWSTKEKECMPTKKDLEKNFKQKLSDELSALLQLYVDIFIPSDYDFLIQEKEKLKIIGTVKSDLIISSGEIFDNVYVTQYAAASEADSQVWSTGADRTKYPGYEVSGWCVIPENQRGFYEEVQCEGSGVSKTGKIYSYKTIKPEEEESIPVEKIGTATDTKATPHRTIAVAPAMIPYNSIVNIKFKDCKNKQCCQVWEGNYIAEDTGFRMQEDWKRGIPHIDIYVGEGRKAIEETTCLPDNAVLTVQPPDGTGPTGFITYTYKTKANFKTEVNYNFTEYQELNRTLPKISERIVQECPLSADKSIINKNKENLETCASRIVASFDDFKWSFECGTEEEKATYGLVEIMKLCAQSTDEGTCLYLIPEVTQPIKIEFKIDQTTRLTSISSASIKENLLQIAPYLINEFVQAKPAIACDKITLEIVTGKKAKLSVRTCGNIKNQEWNYETTLPLYNEHLLKSNIVAFVVPKAYSENKNLNSISPIKNQLRVCAESKYHFFNKKGNKENYVYKISFFAGDAVPPAEVKNIVINDTPNAEEKATISFSANTEEDMSHYDLYYAAKAFSKTDEEGVQKIGSIVHEKGKAKYETTVKLPNDGTFYFAVRAVDTSKNEGIFVAKEGTSKDDLNPGPVQKVEYTKPGLAPRIELSVIPPTTNEDNSELKDLEGYNIYVRAAVGGVCTATDIKTVLSAPENVFKIKQFETVVADQHKIQGIELKESGKQYCLVALADDEVEEDTVQTTQYSENSIISVQT